MRTGMWMPVAAVLAVAVPARAQTVAPAGASVAPVTAPVTAPARIANVFNGKNHEPSPAVVEDREKAVGVAPPPSQRANESDAVQQEASRLIDKTRRETGGVAATTP